MHFSVEGKLFWLLASMLALGAMLGAAFTLWLGTLWLAVALAIFFGLLVALALARIVSRPLRRLLRALAGAVASYHDGDFSVSLVANQRDEFGDLLRAHNALGNALREQREQLTQRELLLETVTQNSPVALLLVDSHRRVVYANIAARQLLHEGRSLQGQQLDEILRASPAPLRDAVTASEDVLFGVAAEDGDETYHLSQRPVRVSGRPHQLYLLKRMTRELSRQEVAIWKKLIRTLSHELNNSLAPISSLANSGAELVRRGETAQLPPILATIRERATHLHGFLASYAAFARLPAPQSAEVDWSAFMQQLRGQLDFRVIGALPAGHGWFDRVQLEQVLINVLKNAHEAGSSADDIELELSETETTQRIEIRDRGSGMSEPVLTQALLPFYSTKRSGTGLGLALSREIIEAHGGQIRLANRPGGGLIVCLSLPKNNSLRSRP